MLFYHFPNSVNIQIYNVSQLALRKIGDAYQGIFAINFNPFVVFCVLQGFWDVHV